MSKKRKVPYTYKEEVQIPLLSFIDDLLSISKCGIDAMENKTFVTTKVELKRLNFNVGSESKKSKCQRLHIGKRKVECRELFANGKEIEEVEDVDYLGDVANRSCDNTRNIKKIKSKGISIKNDILNILDSMSFGNFFFTLLFY